MEIILEADIELKELASKILKEAMEKAGSFFVKNIKMITNPDTASHWVH